MRSLEDEDDHYRKILKEKLHTIDSAGLIHVYRKELGDKLLVSLKRPLIREDLNVLQTSVPGG